MRYPEFLTSLLSDGRVSVMEFLPLTERQLCDGDLVLAEFEAGTYRHELPGNPPPFSPVAARWAATRYFRACQFAVYRHLGAETIEVELTESCENKASPSTHYSVDLVFRFLPDLIKFARSMAQDDPLTAQLRRWSHEWPLSSVGLEVGNIDVTPLTGDDCLLRLYVDRILATGDNSRLAPPAVQAAAQIALGMFTELARGITIAPADPGILPSDTP